MLGFEPMEELSAYAGYTLADIVRRGKPLATPLIAQVAAAVLCATDPRTLDVEATRIDADGRLSFPEARVDRPEDNFCYGFGLMLSSLGSGRAFDASWLLDGVEVPKDLPWPMAHLLRSLTDPSRSRRTATVDTVRRLLSRASSFDPSAQGSWPCFRGSPSRTAVAAAPAGAPPVSSLSVRWYRSYPEILASPVTIGDGFLLVGTSAGRLLVADSQSGASAAEVVLGAAVESTAAVANGLAFVGSDDGSFYAFDVAAGSIRWRRKLGTMIRSSPLAISSAVCVGSIDSAGRSALYCLDAATGKQIWSYRCGDVFSSPAAQGDKAIVVGSDDGDIHCVDAATGRKIWKFKTGAKVRATPAVSGDVFVGSFDETFYCLGPDGTLKWKQTTGKPYYSSPAVGAPGVVCGSHDGAVYCFDPGTGQIRWKYQTGGPVVASPITTGALSIIASTAGTVGILDEGGKPRAIIETSRNLRSSPLLDGETLYVAHDGGISALCLK